MLRRALLSAARQSRVKRLVSTAPVSRDLVARFVAGETVDDAVRVTRTLLGDGLKVTLDHLGEDTSEPEQAAVNTKAYLSLLGRLAGEGLTSGAEVSVKLSAVGQALSESMALDNASFICEAAHSAGTTVTLDMEGHTTVDSTLRVLAELRRTWPDTGGVLQSYLRRTLDDARELATAGSRVRLCKGAYDEPETVAFAAGHEVDLSFVRCLRVLMEGDGYPMVATHDPRLVRITDALVRRAGREKGSYEYQMLHGVRTDEQRRLASEGETVRVYVPYGLEWYGYLMRRLAEHPAILGVYLRAMVTKS